MTSSMIARASEVWSHFFTSPVIACVAGGDGAVDAFATPPASAAAMAAT